MKTLTRLLNPRSIAFIGGNECAIAIRRTKELGFTGTIYAVHPKRDELSGVPTLKSPQDIPEAVDAAFIAVKNEPTIEVVRALAAKGCGGAVIYAAGFAETGNTELQRKLLEAASGMPLMGPNCYGFVNTLSRAALWPDETGLEPVERGVALITQSGNIACNFTMMMRGLPVAAVFSIGNQVDVGMHDMVETLSADPRISAIGLHVEGLPDVAAFARAAAIARQRKVPIVVLKTGRSEQGAKVAMSHTSSLAGADTLYDALFERYGIARMKSVSAFAETLKFLHNGGPIANSRLVSLSCSGGEAALVADMALERKVSFPPFNAETRPRVAATLNEYVAIDNPLDYHTFIWGQPEKLTATFTEVLKGGFDVGMVILDTPTHPKMKPDSWATTARAMAAASKATGARAAVVASLSEGMPLSLAAELSALGVAPMMGLDDALTAFEAAAFIGRNWARSEQPPEMLPPVKKGSEEHLFSESAAKDMLKTHGLAVPEGIVCPAGDAVAAAEKLGYPVTLKVSSAAIAHKTEAGGVALNLRTPAEVEDAAKRMAKLAPDVLVERMVTGAVAELIIGLTSDPQFGTALVVGAGGILTELLMDSVTLILPTTRSEIERALKTLKVWTLVAGFRGKSGDAEAVFRAVEAVADFAAANRGLVEEVDVNPLLVLKDGAIAVDALIKDEEAMTVKETTTGPIIVTRRGRVLEVRIERGKANAIDAATSRIMGDVFAAFRDDPELRVAILTGTGEKFFCPGWDLKAAAEGEAPDSDYGVGGFGGLQELPGLNKPVICAVNGLAFGGGFEIMISCDIIIAAEHATFALPEINSGTVADAASIKLPRRIPYAVAMEMLFTGRRIDAKEAKHWGLINEVVPAADLLERARAVADQLADGPPLVFAAIKEITRDTAHLPVQQAFDLVTKRKLKTVDVLYSSEDQLEGARAFAEKRKPQWKGK